MEESEDNNNIKTVGIVELRNINHETGKDIFIDVRTNDEWNAGHIAWFTHIPLNEIKNHLDEFKKHDRVFFICHTGGRSSMASETLKEAGVLNAHNVDGGMEEWIALGFPVVAS